MSEKNNLYLVETSEHREFYVVAENQKDAAWEVKELWNSWNYLGKGIAIKITLIAEQGQYRTKIGSSELPCFITPEVL